MTLKDRKSNVELRNKFGIESIREVMRWDRVRWFGHVERMWSGSCVRMCISMNVNGRRARGCPRKTWDVLLRDDLKSERPSKRGSKGSCSLESSH